MVTSSLEPLTSHMTLGIYIFNPKDTVFPRSWAECREKVSFHYRLLHALKLSHVLLLLTIIILPQNELRIFMHEVEQHPSRSAYSRLLSKLIGVEMQQKGGFSVARLVRNAFSTRYRYVTYFLKCGCWRHEAHGVNLRI